MCTQPKIAQSYICDVTGLKAIRFKNFKGEANLQLPCKKCKDCKLKKAREWSIRCWHESQMHHENAFVTFTYDDEHLPPYGNLRHSDFQKFIKRFRDKNPELEIKYFMCGEYGDNTHRPHYHAIIFGYYPPDAVFHRREKGHNYYKSESLDSCWKNGFTDTTSVSYTNAGYLARYSLKKQIGSEDLQDRYTYLDEFDNLQTRQFEYIRMSTGRESGQGIGASWLHKHWQHVLENDYVLNPHQTKLPVPRYYLDILARDVSADKSESNSISRIEKAQSADISTPERLANKAICVEANNRNHTRPYL
nr:MAG: replication initiation protein [Microvirus sp.]